MSTDLFRIAMSSGIDRNRYIAALLSSRRSISKSGIPECLRPGKPASKADKKASAGVQRVEPRHPGN